MTEELKKILIVENDYLKKVINEKDDRIKELEHLVWMKSRKPVEETAPRSSCF